MIPAWIAYWKKKAILAERKALSYQRAGYPELAEQYHEEAQEITERFLADAVIVEDTGVAAPTEPDLNFESLSELEKRYLDGDR